MIYCKDCIYCDTGLDERGRQFYKCLDGHNYGGVTSEDFCSHAVSKLVSKLQDAVAYVSAHNVEYVPIEIDLLIKTINFMRGD